MKIMLNHKISKNFRFFCIFIAFFRSLLNLFFFILGRFKPAFEVKASHSAKIKATDIINKATESVFCNISSCELVILNKNELGDVTSVSADTVAINKLKTTLSKRIQEFAEDSENSTVYIPIGSLTNFSVLQGVGYRIPVNVSTDGFTKIDFDDEFISCGINQVKHKIYMVISVRISVISSVFTKTETVTSEVPVSETIISGTVPNYYGDNMSILGR